jgi:hypothetical protein
MAPQEIFENLLAKYHRFWFLRLSPELTQLKSTGSEQIRCLREENQCLTSWESLVWNENKDRQRRPFEKLLAIRQLIQNVSVLLFPHWVMDRFKEALDQYVRGEWLSSIVLCAAIVEFVTEDFFKAYREEIPKGHLPKRRGVIKNLEKLRQFGILNDEDYCRLRDVRDLRDNHIHLMLLGRDVKLLRLDSARALKNLCEFFDEANMRQHYQSYFSYADELTRGDRV